MQIPGRMTLTITTLLTLVSMSNGVFNNSPRTSYLKRIDIWLLGCFSSAFAVLLVYTTLIFLNTRADSKMVYFRILYYF